MLECNLLKIVLVGQKSLNVETLKSFRYIAVYSDIPRGLSSEIQI